ncbi:MAG: hypothetical protein JXR37_06655 [Kiritimatiellae bacterium]|nr:hypothetical protein [Kiritimatiellia bacterium]
MHSVRTGWRRCRGAARLAACIAAGLAAPAAHAEEPVDLLFQRGLHFEAADGDAERAIATYSRIVQRGKTSGSLAARALHRMGVCHEKRGEPAAAGECAARLRRDCADLLPLFPAMKRFAERHRAEPGGQPDPAKKLAGIVIPEFVLNRATVPSAVQALQQLSVRHDADSPPESRGVTIVLNVAGIRSQELPALTLKLQNVSVLEALKRIAEMSGLKFRAGLEHVTVVHRDASFEPIIRRIFPVKPVVGEAVMAMMCNMGAEGGRDGKGPVGLCDCKSFFLNMGVAFPKGSSAFYDTAKHWLIVENEERHLAELKEVWEETLEAAEEQAVSALRARLETCRIPAERFLDADIRQVLARLRDAAAGADPDGKGVALVFGPRKAEVAPLTLDLAAGTLLEAIEAVTEEAGLRYKILPGSVRVGGTNTALGPVVTRVFPLESKVAEAIERSVAAGGEPPGGPPADARDYTAYFRAVGVPFPAGTSARLDPSTNLLVVANEKENFAAVEDVLGKLETATRARKGTEPGGPRVFRVLPSVARRLAAEAAAAGVVIAVQGPEGDLVHDYTPFFRALDDAFPEQGRVGLQPAAGKLVVSNLRERNRVVLRRVLKELQYDKDLRRKMQRLRVPAMEFRQAGIGEVVAFLVAASREQDPLKQGVNIILNLPETHAARLAGLSMNVRNMSLLDGVNYVAEVTGLTCRLDQNAVVITARNPE